MAEMPPICRCVFFSTHSAALRSGTTKTSFHIFYSSLWAHTHTHVRARTLAHVARLLPVLLRARTAPPTFLFGILPNSPRHHGNASRSDTLYYTLLIFTAATLPQPRLCSFFFSSFFFFLILHFWVLFFYDWTFTTSPPPPPLPLRNLARVQKS